MLMICPVLTQYGRTDGSSGRIPTGRRRIHVNEQRDPQHSALRRFYTRPLMNRHGLTKISRDVCSISSTIRQNHGTVDVRVISNSAPPRSPAENSMCLTRARSSAEFRVCQRLVGLIGNTIISAPSASMFVSADNFPKPSQASHSTKKIFRTPKINKFKDIFKDKSTTIGHHTYTKCTQAAVQKTKVPVIEWLHKSSAR